MRLPRRVPWRDTSDLDQLCRWIYSDQATIESKQAAVDRLSAWRVNTALPHALESVLALLTVVVQDYNQSNQTMPGSSSYHLRQGYALAIIRMVNGLVDPLQQGAYARPIAAIAAQIGLPAWLVELRHAATHEDLPSLKVLRDAANEGLDWLLHHYFIPTISPSSTSDQDKPLVPLTPLAPLLKEYKSLMKLHSKDASLRIKRKHEVTRIFREFERWIGEAKVAAGLEFSTAISEDLGDGSGDDWKVQWAIDTLCGALLEKNGLVPVSKKKRASASTSIELPPNEAIWEPLLSYLSTNYPSFPGQLTNHILSTLGGATNTASPQDISYETALANWIQWIVTEWNDEPYCSEREVVITLLGYIGKSTGGVRKQKTAKILVDSLTTTDLDLQTKASMLLTSLEQPGLTQTSSDPSPQEVLHTMQSRLDQLSASLKNNNLDQSSATEIATPTTPTMDIDETDMSESTVAPGWRLLSQSSWKPCPIGVFQSSES